MRLLMVMAGRAGVLSNSERYARPRTMMPGPQNPP